MEVKMILTALIISVVGMSLIALPLISAERYELEMTIQFQEDLGDKDIAKFISKFPKHNFRAKEEIDYPWDTSNSTNLKQFVYSDSVFMNQLLAENIKKEISVIWVEFHPKQMTQRYTALTTANKIEYYYDENGESYGEKGKIGMTFKHPISNEEMRAFIKRYERFEFKPANISKRGLTHSFYFNHYLIDENEFVLLIKLEEFVGWAWLHNIKITADVIPIDPCFSNQ